MAGDTRVHLTSKDSETWALFITRNELNAAYERLSDKEGSTSGGIIFESSSSQRNVTGRALSLGRLIR